MHTVKLEIEDDIYQNIMFLLNNLNLQGLEIKEEEENNTKHKIQQLFKEKEIDLFTSIDDPLAWQDQQRDQW